MKHPSLNDIIGTVGRLRIVKATGACKISVKLHRTGGAAMIHGLHVVLTAIHHLWPIPPNMKWGLVIPFWRKERVSSGMHFVLQYYSSLFQTRYFPIFSFADLQASAEIAKTWAVRMHSCKIYNWMYSAVLCISGTLMQVLTWFLQAFSISRRHWIQFIAMHLRISCTSVGFSQKLLVYCLLCSVLLHWECHELLGSCVQVLAVNTGVSLGCIMCELSI